MSERYRLNLEAPFLNAVYGADQRPAPTNDTTGFQRPATDQAADKQLRRPPVAKRTEADFSGETMARYINGLEARLVAHMRKHAPHWHEKETRRILERWTAPAANHPAPGWAPPRDMQADARDYAATLLRGRLAERMNQIGNSRIARYLGGHGEVAPLHLIFHNRSTQLPEMRRKHKI